jgi:D-proline reductase (dithiol) PrdB
MGADELMRSVLAKAPVPDFETTARTEPKLLSRARVAIVTTAGLSRPGEVWEDQSSAFRTIGRDERDIVLGHNSTNFDRSGYAVDRNVAFPIDRLEELEREGAIGSVAPRHLSFLGSTFELSTMRLDTGPQAARLLRSDGVDIVLLTPV